MQHSYVISSHKAVTITFSNYGLPNKVLQAVEYELPQPGLDEVTLKLIAAPINPADLNQIEGTFASKPEFSRRFGCSEAVAVPGNEGVSEVIALGKADSNELSLGDWVIPKTASFGTWAAFKNAKVSDLISLGKPNGLTPLQAATIAVNPLAAYRMLKDFVELERDDWFIVNGGNSGVCRLSVQLAKLWGVKSISVIRDDGNLGEVKQELHALGADHVITEEQLAGSSIERDVNEWTQGKMCKLALNSVGGKSSANIACQLADKGTIVTYGDMSKKPVEIPASLYIYKDIVSRGFWVTKWKKNNPKEFEQLIQSVAAMFREKKLKLTAVASVDLLDVEKVRSDELLSLFKSSIAKKGKNVIVVK